MDISLALQVVDRAVGVGGVTLAADVALILLGVLALVAVIALIVLLIQIRALGRALHRVTRNLETKADPILERARGIATNVEFISAAVRTDVEQLNASVRALSDRLQQASDHMETRIDEFNALMEVVQGEAEDVFLDTASTVRGVREGARRLAAPNPPGPPDRGEPAPGPENGGA